MSKKRDKIHKPGERLSVYLNKELPDHFFDWIAKQDDVSAFVIYALEQLYSETGNKNVANMLPRRFHFEDTKTSIQQRELVKVPVIVETITSEFEHDESTASTASTESAESTAPTESTASTAPTASTESTAPTASTASTAPTESTASTASTESAESTASIESNDLEDNSLETKKWANTSNVDPDNF
ncbi:hypothetical protein [Sporosarcina sp. E16_8]|uniref:hypothetical protein n=1 Tax=Sporosarcina sp. E16_8 TaxID=2789295 RepID=UPI001A931B6D|nr:hypothetical protein [Sporosarcina sp. E16_8]MBO0588211.1 hypothetical protein [Sporosarcina sp. E16_8]